MSILRPLLEIQIKDLQELEIQFCFEHNQITILS
jgi:hypothetical protein